MGVSKIVKNQLAVQNTRVGTPLYLAPELVKQKPYDFKIDVWAMGCVAYQMCSLKAPFAGENLISLGYNIVHNQPQSIPSSYSSDLSSLVNKLLEKNPIKRPSSSEVLSLVQSYVDNKNIPRYNNNKDNERIIVNNINLSSNKEALTLKDLIENNPSKYDEKVAASQSQRNNNKLSHQKKKPSTSSSNLNPNNRNGNKRDNNGIDNNVSMINNSKVNVANGIQDKKAEEPLNVQNSLIDVNHIKENVKDRIDNNSILQYKNVNVIDNIHTSQVKDNDVVNINSTNNKEVIQPSKDINGNNSHTKKIDDIKDKRPASTMHNYHNNDMVRPSFHNHLDGGRRQRDHAELNNNNDMKRPMRPVQSAHGARPTSRMGSQNNKRKVIDKSKAMELMIKRATLNDPICNMLKNKPQGTSLGAFQSDDRNKIPIQKVVIPHSVHPPSTVEVKNVSNDMKKEKKTMSTLPMTISEVEKKIEQPNHQPQTTDMNWSSSQGISHPFIDPFKHIFSAVSPMRNDNKLLKKSDDELDIDIEPIREMPRTRQRPQTASANFNRFNSNAGFRPSPSEMVLNDPRRNYRIKTAQSNKKEPSIPPFSKQEFIPKKVTIHDI